MTKSRRTSETVVPLAVHTRLKSSATTSGTLVPSSAVALPKYAGKPVERDNGTWASESLEVMLLRVRQGVADEYFRRAHEVLMSPQWGV